MILIYIYTNVVSVKGALAMAHIGRLMYIYIYIYLHAYPISEYLCVYIYIYTIRTSTPQNIHVQNTWSSAEVS